MTSKGVSRGGTAVEDHTEESEALGKVFDGFRLPRSGRTGRGTTKQEGNGCGQRHVAAVCQSSHDQAPA